nr:12083_t:CDS:2 [Entrophospora candida]
MPDLSTLSTVLPKLPTVFSSVIDYYRYGPPQPSWDLRFYLTYRFLKKSFDLMCEYTIEYGQQGSFASFGTIDDDILINELTLSNSLRKKSQIYIDEILKDYNHVLLDDWKSFGIGNGLECEWVYVKEKNEKNESNDKKKKYDKVILYLHGGAYALCSTKSHRMFTSKIAKLANAKVFAINYRLAPQNQFPAALHDSITAYNYLINPPKDANFLPIEPKNIVIMGDSAGGGLVMATLLAIRDSKLPSPAGAVMWSPWVDLSHSMPSAMDPKFNESDYLTEKNFQGITSPAWEEFEQKAKNLTEKIQFNVDNKPKFWHKSFDHDDRLHLYVSNEGAAIPYVSPLLAESLGGLPPILVQAGDGEKLRDECIYLAHKAANPGKYNLPYYHAEKFEKSPYKAPTKVVLEIYEEMPHVFQFSILANVSLKRSVEFIEQLLSGEEQEKELKTLRVTSKGKIIEGLREEHHKVLEWENVGIALRKKTKLFCKPVNNDKFNGNDISPKQNSISVRPSDGNPSGNILINTNSTIPNCTNPLPIDSQDVFQIL